MGWKLSVRMEAGTLVMLHMRDTLLSHRRVQLTEPTSRVCALQHAERTEEVQGVPFSRGGRVYLCVSSWHPLLIPDISSQHMHNH